MKWQRWVAGLVAVVMGAGFFLLSARQEARAAVSPPRPNTAVRTMAGMSVSITGAKSGQIMGDMADGSVRVIAYSHEIVSPRDAASGQATGKRQHKPLVITKTIDKASPLLMKALVTNENLKEVTLRLADARGVYYTIKLTNATVSGLKQAQGDDGREHEEISFTYQKIEWTWTDGGITAMDDWETPVN